MDLRMSRKKQKRPRGTTEAAALGVPRGENALDRLSGIHSGRDDPKDRRRGAGGVDPAVRLD